MLPYTSPSDKRFNTIPYMPFIDYKSGISSDDLGLDSKEFWKSLTGIIEDYMNHPESKSLGDIGLLHRRHVNIDSIRYIGKEANDLEESMVLGVERNSYLTYADFDRWIKSLTTKRANELGISKQSLSEWKIKVSDGKTVKRRSKIWSAFEKDRDG